MCAIASLEIVIRPRGDESACACPASTWCWTVRGRSRLRDEQLSPRIRAFDPAVRAPRDASRHPVDPPFADGRGETQMAFWTLPALRQRVQTYARVALPFRSTRTRWRFGSKRRFVATIEWLRWLPKPGFFPQTAQTLLIGAPV